MRRLIVSMNITRDGFMAGPHCELDWHFSYWDAQMARYATEQLYRVDAILLGRITYSAMAQYWPARMQDLSGSRDDIAFTTMMNACEKIVCSNTLHSTPWDHSRLVRGSIEKAMPLIKSEAGRDIIIYGSGQIVAALAPLSLIDEFQLWVHPVRLGRGKPLFADPGWRRHLRLNRTRKFSSGVIVGHYAWVPAEPLPAQK